MQSISESDSVVVVVVGGTGDSGGGEMGTHIFHILILTVFTDSERTDGRMGSDANDAKHSYRRRRHRCTFRDDMRGEGTGRDVTEVANIHTMMRDDYIPKKK